MIGDVTELLGAPGPATWRGGDRRVVDPGGVVPWADPDAPRAQEVADAAVDAIAALALEAARLRGEEHRLHEELAEARHALELSYLRPSYRLREKIVHLLDTSGPGRLLHRGYRALRGRSSPSA